MTAGCQDRGFLTPILFWPNRIYFTCYSPKDLSSSADIPLSALLLFSLASSPGLTQGLSRWVLSNACELKAHVGPNKVPSPT